MEVSNELNTLPNLSRKRAFSWDVIPLSVIPTRETVLPVTELLSLTASWDMVSIGMFLRNCQCTTCLLSHSLETTRSEKINFTHEVLR